ncbi:MAG: hydrogenase formation protein HypD [Cyanobacteria bacterium]|nr:hydrogenase formation protein HypD [Cyanobacteriota bacterium]
MKYLSEFRDPERAQHWFEAIARRCDRLGRPLKIMEVCGGHTHSIFKYGLETLLPPPLELVHGPGCPVCVMPRGRLDDAIALAQRPEVIFTTFGDTLRVPGSQYSLLQAKAIGADVRAVYSPLDALAIARQNPERQVVFFGIGFETTAPSVALTILQAARDGIENFSVFSNHVLVVPALEALLQNPDLQLDGFIGPGHVSAIIGLEPYQVLPERYGKPVVISGFEPLDLLQSIDMLLGQLMEGRCAVENQYRRLVNPQGNGPAQDAIAQVFTVRDRFEWRGLGDLPRSGLAIAPAYQRFDAEVRWSLPNRPAADSPACQCGEILRGTLKPWQCKVFGTGCTPENPLGTCMVSSEGACAAYYKYGRLALAQTAAPRVSLPATP